MTTTELRRLSELRSFKSIGGGIFTGTGAALVLMGNPAVLCVMTF